MRSKYWIIFFISCILALIFSHETGYAAVAVDELIPAPRVLFDDAHGQSFGNADWTPFHAYSDLAEDIQTAFNATVFSADLYNDGIITAALLENIDLLIIPEPNIRYTDSEKMAIRRFVSSGGSLFLIADHGYSDRNFDGWDSCVIFNDLTEGWGINFLGDTFSETPVRGRKMFKCEFLNRVVNVGAWAATSIIIDPGSWHWLSIFSSQETGFPFIVRGDVGMGRVVAMGDSSGFDDGSGDSTKNRHSAYHSWMFDQRKLAVRTISWLLDLEPESVPDHQLPFPDRNDLKMDDETTPRLIIDASRGNNDADLMNRFASSIESTLNIPAAINLENYSGLRQADILVLTNPSSPLTDEDITHLTQWIRSDGGKIIIAGASARNPLCSIPDLNRLLETLNSSMRLNADQIQDHKSNTGKPWSPKLTTFAPSPIFQQIDSAVFWGCASLVDTTGKRLRDSSTTSVLAWTSPNAISQVLDRFPVKGGSPLSSNPQIPEPPAEPHHKSALPKTVSPKAIPAAALEHIGNGTVILLGADPFTNFQYPTQEEKEQMEPEKWDHQTAEFNLALLRILVKM